MMDVGDETHMLKPNNKGAENYGDGQVFFYLFWYVLVYVSTNKR